VQAQIDEQTVTERQAYRRTDTGRQTGYRTENSQILAFRILTVGFNCVC